MANVIIVSWPEYSIILDLIKFYIYRGYKIDKRNWEWIVDNKEKRYSDIWQETKEFFFF